MNCPKCYSHKLRAHNLSPDHVYYRVGESWVVSNPELGYYHSTRKPFQINCLSCGNHWEVPELMNQVSPSLDHKEIVLDLDGTLFSAEYAYEIKCDFSFKLSDTTYYVVKRPFLDEFINELLVRFEKISFFTSASEDYATNLINSLNIPESKIGFIKTLKDTVERRSFHPERQHMKDLENSLVVEDKPYVIEGYNNAIIKVKEFHFVNYKDQTLKNLLPIFNKKEHNLSSPELFDGEIKITGRDMTLKFSQIPWSQVRIILSISKFEESPSFFTYLNGKGEFSFNDLSYENYLILWSVIKDNTKEKCLSKQSYDQQLTLINDDF